MEPETSVTLQWGAKPEWPARCVVCGVSGPSDTMRAADHSDAVFWPFVRGRKAVAHVPACGACSRDLQHRLRRRKRLESLLVWFTALTVSVAICVWLGTGFLQGALKLAVAIVLLLPWGLWVLRHPLAFQLAADRDGITYVFRDPLYARNFAAANGTTLDEQHKRR